MLDSFEVVIVGSGFAGTIMALSFANTFKQDNSQDNTNKKGVHSRAWANTKSGVNGHEELSVQSQ
jgi:aspartate oxidase